ncbi:polysaccharide biosynthesis/export family protein [Piscinibacter sp. HJYY11]|uniref:polysaccharide biosynthesis/export family protein n=1 Tax=Piscinibacter sp. HJYY11 TaxID=2801333 RepID=UPI00191F8A5C|nr:polysaccharide biosynthesis/export family protein [Piscinibacter sp. HJYY11]MBL0726193.1 polysaccharide biosynthesis/export family protein [Piscinibacter sp. HJYY11]
MANEQVLRGMRGGAVLMVALLSACAGFKLPGTPQQVTAEGEVVAEMVAAPAVALPAAEPGDPAYVIGPEDALEISVWRDETLKAATLVRPDGGISFPLAGDVIVAGKTATQVRDELVKRLSKYVPDPVVTVSVARVASYRIYVLGRVNKPGDFQVGRNIDVLQALSIAGGMTPFASEDGIQIIRKVDGKSTSIPFEYSRIRKGGDLSQNITLKSGDVLLVP